MIELDTLGPLLDHGDGNDRAFIDGVVRMEWARTHDPIRRAELAALHRELRAVALRRHEVLREAIADGSLRSAALRARFDEAPEFERDHFVEEVLGVAYPPLDEQAPVPELIAYTPSGYDEIVHALDVTALGPGDRFVDLGSGMGKAVLLAAVLCGARARGIERDPALHEMARDAADALSVDARFECADARDVEPGDAEVTFMYLPFTGTVFASVMSRLIANAGRFVCCGAVDPAQYPELVEVGPSRSWLHVYRVR